jgi:MFS family permease
LGLYGLLAGALIHALVVTIRGVKETPLTQVIPMPKFAEYLRSLLEPFKSADFRWVWITRALVVMGFYTVQPYLKFFVGDVLKPSDVSTGTLLIGAVVLISAALAGYFGGKLSDKIGRKRTVIWANSLMGVVCVGFAAIVSFPLAIAAAVLFGATYGAYYSVDWALGTDVLPNLEDAGKDMAVWHVAMTLPTSLSAPIAAYAIESGGVTKTLVDGETVFRYQHGGYVALFILAAVYVLLGAFFLRRVKGST